MIYNQNMAQQYNRNKVLTASPAELTLLLYEGAIKFCNIAAVAIEKNDMEKAHTNIVKAEMIIEEFQATLNHKYPVAEDFDKLYKYIYGLLVDANMRKDLEILEQATNELRGMRDTWHMETTNYLQIMIDSLEKKKKVLQDIVDYNIQQENILQEKEFDGDIFQKNMEEKSACIDILNSLDEGFQSVYDRVRDDIQMYKQNYKDDIQRLQELIREVSSLSATIQAQESRNKLQIERKFRQLREETKTAKRSVSMANKYYQNMSRVSNEPQFMDKKK